MNDCLHAKKMSEKEIRYNKEKMYMRTKKARLAAPINYILFGNEIHI
jgi:hypothetical protein